jgi:hypothetical protein
MDLVQIIYSSQPFGYDATTLSGILQVARRRNEAAGITGALVCRRDIYLQLLEGPQAAVDDTLDRIRRDDRHLDVVLRASGPVSGRMFGDWAMLHDPARSWLWTEAEIANGILDSQSEDDFRAVFSKLVGKSDD